MLSHPITFLVGYILITFILSFVVVGPLVVFVSMFFRRRMEKRFNEAFYWGASVTAFGFIKRLHELIEGCVCCGSSMCGWVD